MFIVDNYFVAVLLCAVTMICWGSWGNTQKLAGKTWRYELYYWDYTIGILAFSILTAFTLGSFGEGGRSFLPDIAQADTLMLISAIFGGIVFNAANILLSASISLAGLAVAFPLGVGLALVLGVIVNYSGNPQGDPFMLFAGVACIMVAIVFNGVAAGYKGVDTPQNENTKKGIILAFGAGVLMSFFYRFVAQAMDLSNFESPAAGKITPYTAFFVFAVGIFISNFVFNTLIMNKPFVGKPVTYKEYFKGNLKTHMVGVLGGVIWGLGTVLSYIAAGKAGAAISYGLGQGAPMIAAIWGIFIWKEFKDAPQKTGYQLISMFVFYIIGLGLIVAAGM